MLVEFHVLINNLEFEAFDAVEQAKSGSSNVNRDDIILKSASVISNKHSFNSHLITFFLLTQVNGDSSKRFARIICLSSVAARTI